ncbi:heavy metal translocating P-type ATPase [Trueperella pecoris]|uniref:heavy metal translocating P-type ATPase n=1 Tax=Trueperella pecoris TaxID=2733571 RepID=UPI00186B6FBB|nr:heavy metal translocating P-type ATPase [Trueperella pecoris]QOQ38857.1 cadmium-translocating P-type ATPase [Trueperella pecoris]
METIKTFFVRYPLVAIVVIAGLIGVVLAWTGAEPVARWVVSGVAVFIALLQLKGMVETLREGSFGIDILAVTAIVSTVTVGEYWAALVVCLMLTGGEALEDFAEHRAGAELTALLEGAPTIAYRKMGAGVEEIQVDEVEVGDRLLVRPHETVPVDARLLSERALIDESQLTGESMPVGHVKGDTLLSGSMNGSAAIEVEASATAANSQYQRIVSLVNEARESKAPFVRLADRVAVPFTLAAFVIAGLAWYFSGNPMRFAQVLVVATPCPLIIAAPVAFMAGMSRAARGGMIVKNAGTIEQIAKIKSLAFDKTGTLTRGEPEIAVVSEFDIDELIRLAASAEMFSSHPLAKAIVAAAGPGVVHPEESHDIAAQGVAATVEGKSVKVGKYGFVTGTQQGLPDRFEAGRSAIYVSVDDQLVGRFEYSDPIRPETPATLEAVKSIGIANTVMLTGDSEQAATRVAGELGIDHVRAGLLPEDKVAAVTSLGPRPVMMVGDGVNDAPVLAAADVGVAMGARGSAAAAESADVVIMLDDLTRLPRLLLVGQRTMRIAWQAIAIGVGLSVVLMILGATGMMPAFVGAWMQELVDLACILWALLAARPSKLEENLLLEVDDAEGRPTICRRLTSAQCHTVAMGDRRSLTVNLTRNRVLQRLEKCGNYE